MRGMSNMEKLEDMLGRVSATNNPLSTSEAAQIRNFLSQAVTALSPLRTLPTELLREIFLLFALHSHGYRPSTLRASILLSSVCNRWREVALSIPQLWASICFFPKSQDSSEACVELMKLCVYRSQSYPLSITLGCPYGDDIAMANMLRIAIPHVERWKHLKLNKESLRDVQCSFPTRRAPLLESLTLMTSRFPPSSHFFLWIQSLVRKAPHLHVLQMYPWGQLMLTHIQVRDGLSIETCHSILSQAQYIERCMFTIQVASATPSVLSLITLHHLKECSIETTISLAELFDRISCPALRDITIHQYSLPNNTTRWHKESFSSFMTRSSCLLLSFHMMQPDMTEGDVIQCLRDMPSTLISLELSTFGVTDQVLNLLTVGSNRSGCICPRLERITMSLAIDTTDGVFTNMVESRMHDSTELTIVQISRLRYVYVAFVDHEEDVERLQEWRNRGLDVYVEVVTDME